VVEAITNKTRLRRRRSFKEDDVQTDSLICRRKFPILLRSVNVSEGVRSRTKQFITNVISFGPPSNLYTRTHKRLYKLSINLRGSDLFLHTDV